MKTNFKSYPHPVLGNENDMSGKFGAELLYRLGKKEITLEPAYKLNNKSIDELIRQKKASYVMELECPAAFFRESYSGYEANPKFEISPTRVRDVVSASFYVCAEANISNYHPEGCHSDYEGVMFDVEAGDVLAYGGTAKFIAEKTFDPLRPPISSFMAIREGLEESGPIEVDYVNFEKIIIYLSKQDWKDYGCIRNRKDAEAILHSAIALPVLIDAIYKIRSEDEECKDKKWYARLEAIITVQNLLTAEAVVAAQKILELPCSRSFKSIKVVAGIDEEDDNG